jgi:hypothetical protein
MRRCPYPGHPIHQPDYPDLPGLPDLPDLPAQPFLVYLDVWERHSPTSRTRRSVRLPGWADTARAQIVWQVKVEPDIDACPSDAAWADQVAPGGRSTGDVENRHEESDVDGSTVPCTSSLNPNTAAPRTSYTGLRSTPAAPTAGRENDLQVVRENGSVVFPIRELNGGKATRKPGPG